MNIVLSIIIGILFSASIYLMLSKSFFKLIAGVFIFGYATIFFLFIVSGVTKNAPPLVAENSGINTESLADPLPQALTLTAIVISIGVQAFVIVLLKKAFENVKTANLDKLQSTDNID